MSARSRWSTTTRTAAALTVAVTLAPFATVPAFASGSGAAAAEPIDPQVAAVVPEHAGSGDLADLVGGMSLADIDLTVPRTSPGPGGAGSVLPRPAARAVIGTDTRVAVPDVTVQPYSHTALLLITGGDGQYLCSGALVAPTVLVTAQHCLYDLGGAAGPAASVVAVLGSDGTREGFACTALDPVVPKTWAGAQPAEDWGVVELDCNAGAVVGYYGHRDPGQVSPSDGDWSITGYPADLAIASGYPMYTASGPVSTFGPQQLAYTISTAGGQSGAPIWRAETDTGCGNCLIGVHTSTSRVSNFGTRLTLGFAEALEWVLAGRP